MTPPPLACDSFSPMPSTPANSPDLSALRADLGEFAARVAREAAAQLTHSLETPLAAGGRRDAPARDLAFRSGIIAALQYRDNYSREAARRFAADLLEYANDHALAALIRDQS